MKILSLAVAASLALVALGVAPRAFSKDKAKRHNVLDAFYLLPYVGNTNPTKTERREMLAAKYHPIIDLKNDYLKVQPDSCPAQQVAIFRDQGTEVVAVSISDYSSDYNTFNFYRLRDGKLREVTAKELPVPVRQNKYLYELPRIGTTIRVYKFDLHQQKRWHAFDLKWRGGRFVKAPIR